MRPATRTLQSAAIEATAPSLFLVTGLIYVILIAVWGVVLVPRWLRRHDEMREAGDSEALEAALKSESGLDEHASVEPANDEHERWHPEAGRAATWGEYLGGMVQIDYDRYTSHLKRRGTGLASTARRRRKIVIALAVVVGVSLIGAVVGVLPGALVVLSSFLLGGYVCAMVIFMRSGTARNGSRSDERGEVPASTHGQTRETSGAVVDGVRVVGAETDSWEPRETTLPTYVTKTKASKIPRRIDLTSGWTGADMVEQARQQQASPQLEQQFDREWAVVAPEPEADVAGYAAGELAPDTHIEDDGYYRRAVNE
jgi:hypothetical protein